MPKAAKKQSKAAFVKESPLDVSADEVIAKAKEKGLTLSRADVHGARYTMRQKDAASPTKTKVTPRKAAPTVKPRSVSATAIVEPQRRVGDGVDRDFVRLALRVGLERSRGLLERLEQQVDKLAL